MYRQDIADELELKFETLDDLDNAFAAVKEAYPDMTTCAFNCAHKILIGCFNRWDWQEVDMQKQTMEHFSGGQSRMSTTDYYKKVNEWYRNGYISAENFAYQSEDETKEVCVGRKSICKFWL